MAATRQRRIALMGYRAVGKSTITIRFAENHFVDTYNPTIENTYVKTFRHKNIDYEMELIDTSGQDEFSIFQRQYAIGIHAYILVYSVNDAQSFEMVKIINDKILNAVGSDHVPRMLVGNKADLEGERVVSREEGAKLAAEWGCPFVECSAKQNTNIGDVFRGVIDAADSDLAGNTKKEGGCVIQ